MSKPLRILFVEDLPTDQELAEWQLRTEGLQFVSTRVETREAYLQALDEFRPDVIISDYAMPEFDGMQALRLIQERGRDIPFIVLTGSMNEDTAVECMKAGALDYVIKEHTHRLPFAVQEALAKQQIRIEKDTREEQLRDNQALLQAILDNIPVMIALRPPQPAVIWVNHACETTLGWSVKEWQTDDLLPEIYPDPKTRQEAIDFIGQAGSDWRHFKSRRRDGTIIDTLWANIRLRDDTTIGIGLDVTQQRQTEETLRQTLEAVRELSRRLADVEENDRKHLASELHDTIGQELTALSIQIQVARDMLAEQQAGQALERLEEASRIVEHTSRRVREIMVDLRPPLLDEYGLLAALRWYGEQFARRNDLTVTVQGDEPAAVASSAVSISLFRITQEALNNISKHAQAGQVTIHLNAEGDEGERRLCLTIADDGVGFPVENQTPEAPESGWGLRIMRERAEAIGGRFSIQSTPEQGTRISVEVGSER